MAKVSLARKKELNEPDEFITFSNKALEYARQNKSMITAVVFASVAILVSITGYQYYSKAKEKNASIRFSEDVAWYDQLVKDHGKDVSLTDVKEKQEAFLKKYSGTSSAILARAKYAGIFYDQGDYSTAASLFEDALSDTGKDSALRNIFMMNLGQCYEAMDKTDLAVTQYKKIVSGKEAMKKDEALFHLGLIYEKMDKKDESKDAFTQLADQFKDSMFAQLAKDKMNG